MKKIVGIVSVWFLTIGVALAQTITPVPYEKNKVPANNNWGNGDGSVVWTNGDGTLCWRSGSWTPETANARCDGAKPAPKPTQVRIEIKGDTLFVFDKTELTAEGRTRLQQVMKEIASATKLTSITVTGYTDSFGSAAYNMKLSQARADTIKEFLLKNGYSQVTINSIGRGKTNYKVDGQQFKGSRAKKIEFEQPNRRVELEINGFKEVMQ